MLANDKQSASEPNSLTSENTPFGPRYQVVRPLGRGGMAEVHLAVDTTLDRPVAIKAIPPHMSQDAGFRNNFRNEARAAACMTSPFVVGIYDWEQNANSCFIVMEYVRGIDLKNAIAKRGPLHPRKVAEIAVQACTALEEAHARGIIHRDIKPSNIMMQTSGNIKIMDFGIASGSHHATGNPAPIAGTASYMSPEQKRGLAATPQSDLYSLGATLYELCTDVLPNTTTTGYLENALPGTLVPAHHLNSGVDRQMSELLDRALQSEPSRRFPNAQEMRRAFEAYLAQADQMPAALPYPDFWVLACTQGPETVKGTLLPFRKTVTIGRNPDADIVIHDATVSGKHTRLAPRGMYLLAEDLFSINGTLVNEAPLLGKALCLPGTILSMGSTRLRIGAKQRHKL